jgi:DNA polymerase-3 subunit beta
MMQFSAMKSDIFRELGLSQGAVEKKTTIPILGNVLVEASGSQVNITTTNLELGVRCSFPANVKAEGRTTLPMKRLVDYIRLLPDAEISAKTGDNHWTAFACGRSKTRISGMSVDSYPELPTTPDAFTSIPVGQLCVMMKLTAFAISNEESRFTINGALLVIKSGHVSMVATDGHRMSFVTAELPDSPDFKSIIPKQAMTEILKLSSSLDADSLIEISADENHLFFVLGGRTLISRKMTGSFPDYERVLPSKQAHEVVLNREELKAALERVVQSSDERSRKIEFKFSEGELVISAETELGSSEENISVPYSGPEIAVAFNAADLLDLLRVVIDDAVAMLFTDGASAGELRPITDGAVKFRYVVMPMRF